eukprot:1638848-Rhodomonas_salina.2
MQFATRSAQFVPANRLNVFDSAGHVHGSCLAFLSTARYGTAHRCIGPGREEESARERGSSAGSPHRRGQTTALPPLPPLPPAISAPHPASL